MSMQWFKMHHGTVANPVWRLAAIKAGVSVPDVLGVWLLLMEEASSAEDRGSVEGFRGELADVVLGFALGTSERIFSVLCAERLVEGMRIVSWDHEQAVPARSEGTGKKDKSGTARKDKAAVKAANAERSRRCRARKKVLLARLDPDAQEAMAPREETMESREEAVEEVLQGVPEALVQSAEPAVQSVEPEVLQAPQECGAEQADGAVPQAQGAFSPAPEEFMQKIFGHAGCAVQEQSKAQDADILVISAADILRNEASGRKLSEREQAEAEFRLLRAEYNAEGGRLEGPKSGLRQYLRLRRSESFPGIDVLIASVRDHRLNDWQWRAGYAPGLARWLREEAWNVPPRKRPQSASGRGGMPFEELARRNKENLMAALARSHAAGPEPAETESMGFLP